MKISNSYINNINRKDRIKYKDDGFALQTDLYEINMVETYWDDNLHNRRTIFDAYVRKLPFNNSFAVFAGLNRVIDYIANFRFMDSDIDYLSKELGYKDDFLEYLKTIRFDGNIKSLVEGEIFYPNEPMIQVDAKLAVAQLIETPLLNILNFHPLIATKAARIRNSLVQDEIFDNADIFEFGMRRSHEFDAGLYGARAAYIGGFTGTSNVRAGKLFGIPVKGTHAHSMVQIYGDDYIAFKKYASRHKNCIFLVDTYDTLKSGVPNAIRVAKELGNKINFVGIRLDSGDLAHLSKEARIMLDEAGFNKAKIYASNDLDEYQIIKLKEQGAKIDGWGIGTKVITAYDQPAFGGVYKLAAFEDENGEMVDTLKLSEDTVKTSIPGIKKILRVVDFINQKSIKDYIALYDENFDIQKEYIDNYRIKELHKQIIKDGKIVYKQPSVEEMRAYCMSNLAMLENTFRQINDPENYEVELTKTCFENKIKNIEKAKEKINF